jgi:hypothetical protein
LIFYFLVEEYKKLKLDWWLFRFRLSLAWICSFGSAMAKPPLSA